MAHVEKYTKAVTGHMCAHYDRSANNIGNENIDPKRTKENYNLAPEKNQIEFINQRCGEVQCLKRNDINVMCTWIVTSPKDLPETDQTIFFQAAYDFLNKRYGKDNVISAHVHMDEIQPHIHYAFVPVVVDKKKGHEKVSAKEKINRADLQTFHQDLEKHMAKIFGREIGILNEATREGNRSIEELKRQSATDRLQEVKEIVKNNVITSSEKLKEAEREAARIVQNAKNDVKHLNSDLRLIQAEYDAKRAYVKTFVKQDSIFKGVTEKKGLTGKIKGYELTPEVWEKTTVSYMDMVATEKMKDSIEGNIENYKKSTSYQQVAKMRSSLDSQIKNLQKENKELRENNEKRGNEIDRVLKVFEFSPEVEKAFYETEKLMQQQEQEQRRQSRGREMEL